MKSSKWSNKKLNSQQQYVAVHKYPTLTTYILFKLILLVRKISNYIS